MTRVAIVVASLALLATCADGDDDSLSAGGPRVSPTARDTLTPSQTTPGLPPTTNVGGLGEPAEVSPGAVTVALSKASFRLDEDVVVTVANGRGVTIFTEDSKSACTIVVLERWENDSWQELRDCALGRAPAVVAIGPARGRTVRIAPTSTHFRRPLAGGIYRVKFTYRLARGPEAVEPEVSASHDLRLR